MSDSTPAHASAPTPAPAPAPKKKSPARFITPALALVAALVLGGVGGVLIGQNTASASGPSAFGPGGGPQFQSGDLPGGGFTSGTVSAIDGDSFTVTLADGSTVTVTTTADTTVTTTNEATVADLAEGDTVRVIGETDDDGNVTATSVSEGDLGFGGPDVQGGQVPTGAPTTNTNG
jgi:endonuclease YncB( thermonuclease family)